MSPRVKSVKNKRDPDAKRRSGSAGRGGSRVASVRPVAIVQPPKPVHESVRRYLACVANPFSGPLARGISGNHPSHQTVVLRRRNVISLTIGTGTFAPGTASVAGGGTDIIIPLASTLDPYIIAASAEGPAWSNSWRTSFGKQAATLLPTGSLFRTVSAGVRITPTNASDRVSGAFAIFAPTPFANADTTSELVTLGPSLGYGAVRADLNEAVAIVPTQGSKTITFTAPVHDIWTPVDTAETNVVDSTVVGAPLNWRPTAHIRLWYQASTADPQNFLVEVSQVVEYYHDSHSVFAEKAISHPDGMQITQAVAAVMAEPGSNISSANSSWLYNRLRQAAGIAEAGGELIYNAARTAFTAKKSFDVLKGLYTGAQAAGELALLA